MKRDIFRKVLVARQVQHLQFCLCWVSVLAQGRREEYLGGTIMEVQPLASGLAAVSKCQLWLWSRFNSLPVFCLYYCTSLACCYSKNRTDSSSLRNTTVNKTTQANFLLSIWRCSLWVPKAHESVRVKPQYNISYHCCCSTLLSPTAWIVSSEYDRPLKINNLESRNSFNSSTSSLLQTGSCCIALQSVRKLWYHFLYSWFQSLRSNRPVLKTYALVYISVLYPEEVLHLDSEKWGSTVQHLCSVKAFIS